MKKKIVLSVMLLVMIAISCIALVGCKEDTIHIKLEYQIIDSLHVGDTTTIGSLLRKPQDPTFENKTFNAGIGVCISDNIAEFEMPIENPRMGEGFDVNKDYLFIGWYKEPECIRPWNFSEDRAFTDLSLYAKWIEKSNFL